MNDFKCTLRDGRTLAVAEAVPADACELLAYMKIVGGETDFLLVDAKGLPLTVEQEQAFLEDKMKQPNSALLLGRIGGELAATVGVSGTTHPRLSHIADVGISVEKKFWHIGVGGAMMEAAFAFAREAGIRSLTLGARADNTRAIALYERLGFVQYGRRKDALLMRGEYYDEILMQLML